VNAIASTGEWLESVDVDLSLDARRLLVHIPMGFTDMLARNPELALAWRICTRAIFTTYFDRSYRAVHFMLDRPGRRGTYVLARIAGTTLAAIVMSSTPANTAAYVSGSVVCVSNRKLAAATRRPRRRRRPARCRWPRAAARSKSHRGTPRRATRRARRECRSPASAAPRNTRSRRRSRRRRARPPAPR